MLRLRDLAEQLDLSETTISRVLNGQGRVSDATRNRVLAHVERVGYRPNRLAMGLRLQRSCAVGVLLPDITNAFHSNLYRAIDGQLRAAGYSSILFDSCEDKRNEGEYVQYLQSSVIDGMIIATSGSDTYQTLEPDLLRRITFVDNRPDITAPINYIGSENLEAADALTQHMIDRGHRELATLVGDLTESSARERFDGFVVCLERNGIALPDDWVVQTNFLYQDGYEKAHGLFGGPRRPTGIVAQNNVLAYAAVRVATELGMGVPQDVAIACFDHLDPYGFMRPVITSAVQSIPTIASKAVSCLLDQIEDRDTEPAETLVPVEFRAGDTT
ncbi:MAG: LacI family DNA-binding transcriptional regulator [Propionicimonas sp.]|nr:LacI family DNA-binding transcriptional regulator [Propionicimonas sp.]